MSVVVCTRNRAFQLVDALKRWETIKTNVSWELVMVDNASTDDTPRVLAEYRERLGGRLRVVSESRAGLGRARNAGWRAASSELIAFTDDDCYPAEDYVDRIIEVFGDRSIGFIGGRILLFDPTDLPITIQLLDQRVDIPANSFVTPGFIQGANFAFRREVLTAVGGFDPLLGAGTPFGCEDVDVVGRASSQGFRGRYDPSPYVYHHHRRKTREDQEKLIRSYDVARGAYYAKGMLNRASSRDYIKRWVRRAVTQNPIRTYRELSGGIRFALAARAES